MATDSLTELAIVALTRRGTGLGRRLKVLLPESHFYLPDKFAPQPDEHAFALPAASLIKDIFGGYRYLVLIMAVGIAVRLIASEAKDKHKDPGVVVIDDCGQFAVSLLSGHVGGANELTRKIASLLGAQAVITTASDSSGTISPDLLGKASGWEIEDSGALTRVSAVLVNGEPVGVYQDAGETGWQDELPANARVFPSLESLKQSDCQAALVVSDRVLDSLPMPAVVYRPKSLVLGLGCNRGTECADIDEAVTRVFAQAGLSPKCLRNLATIDLKKNETGLLEFTAKYRLPVEYFSRESLRGVNVPSEPSLLALKHIGVPAVCEAAAILSGRNLIVTKASFKKMITLAVARPSPTPARHPERSEGPLSLSNRRDSSVAEFILSKANVLPQNDILGEAHDEKSGKLSLVGIGPGDPSQMTFRARQVIAGSEVVAGYRSYIDLIRPLLSGKEVIATAMGREVERVNRAIDLAGRGKTVALVSSGDSGVYGMAGLVGEIMHQRGLKLDIEVIPGVPAMFAAGALLGSPLSADAAYISLSNHLLPWAKIALRLHTAAQGDFVIALYNPKSKARQNQLKEAQQIVLKYRSPQTPVGIVTNAHRPAQSVIITDLAHMLENPVDMNTIIIIGNSTTLISGNWMVTPRGYHTKYSLGKDIL